MAISSLSFRSYVNSLSGRRLGAFKCAAAKLGISFDDYIKRIECGQKNCIDCRDWKPQDQFSLDASRWDGLSAKCSACSSARGKLSHISVPAENLACPGPPRESPRNGDKEHARHLINLEVRTGKRPHPDTLHCVKCGHKRSMIGDDKRHEYHHHMGYSAEHVYDVVPLCTTCHHQEDS